MRTRNGRLRAFGLSVCVGVLAAAMLCASADAASSRPAWRIHQQTTPTYLPPGTTAASIESPPRYEVTLVNVGGATAEGVSVSDTLPEGVHPTSFAYGKQVVQPQGEVVSEERFECEPAVAQTVTCEIPYPVYSGRRVSLIIGVDVAEAAPEASQNLVTVSSSNTPTTSQTSASTISAGRSPYALSAPDAVGAAAYDESGGSPAAGSHPLAVEFYLHTPTIVNRSIEFGEEVLAGAPLDPLRNVGFELPPGMVVDPRATAVRCPQFDLITRSSSCPRQSQVGLLELSLGSLPVTGQLFNLVPPQGVPAELAGIVNGIPIRIRGGLDGSFRLTAASTEIISRYNSPGFRVELWGNPSDSRHDGLREHTAASIETSPKAFLTMPSACSSSLPTRATVTGWLGDEAGLEAPLTTPSGEVEKVEGCEKLSFEPSVSVATQSHIADTSTGLHFDLKVPQNETLNGLASATVKRVSVRLPKGMTVNPALANGLMACSPAQVGLGGESPATCPSSSKIGSAEIVTPLFEAPLKGSIYLAEQGNNPFGTLLALYLVVEGEGIVIKLPGRVDTDLSTGQLTTVFDNNPQLPFEELRADFSGGDGSPRATLITPGSCGSYEVETELTSWASPTPVILRSPMTISQGCNTGGFSPKLDAGTTNPAAASFSPFTLRVTRQDGEQNLSKISATLPEGLLAKLAGVPLCPETQTASGNCPAASRVGDTITGVGAGGQPLYIPQQGKSPTAIYLAGSYRGAPYSLVVKVPAEAGPFNLGTIAVRVALNVDPFTAQVTATSEPLPQILEGIPVAYRDVRVEVTRPEFVLNPTSCEPKQVSSLITSASNATATPSSRFQVADCSRLAFKPTLKLSLRGATKRVGHPALKAVLTYPKKGSFANIARAQVNLPHSVFLDQGNLNKTCTKPVLLEGKCPKTTIYGKAKAWTPLLERPVGGPVYLVGGFGYKLPALVAELNGQINVLLKGKVDSGPNKGIRNTFEAVPDAPVSRFVLELKGGKKYSLLENSEPLCRKSQHAIARFTAQNGAIEQLHPQIGVSCGKGRKAGGKRAPGKTKGSGPR
jgi:uncharacterized repeat protein (TIGR01451 family)